MSYTPFEIRDALESLTVLIDTREQDTERARKRKEDFPHWRREKLDAGDYGCEIELDGEPCRVPVVVERKMSLDELCQCFTRERKRFEREFEHAQQAGTRLHLLIENASWEKIHAGSYRSQMKPQALTASILAWQARYDARVYFCTPELTGKMIAAILHYETKIYLEGQA